MAIQHSPGVVASRDDFLEALMNFAAANAGFTRLADDTSGAQRLYRLSRAGDADTYWCFRARTGTSHKYGLHRMEARMMTIAASYAQFSASGNGQPYLTVADTYSYADTYTGYTFYSDGNNVFAILEVRQNVFTMLGFGKMIKTYLFDGGEFLVCNNYARQNVNITDAYYGLDSSASFSYSNMLFGARSSSYSAVISTPASPNNGGTGALRTAITGDAAQQFYTMGYDSANGNDPATCAGTVPPANRDASFNKSPFNSDLFYRLGIAGKNSGILRAPLFPIYILLRNPSVSNTLFIAGYIDNLRIVNMVNFNARDITLTDWRVFPYCSKTGDNKTHPLTYDYGFAFKEIP